MSRVLRSWTDGWRVISKAVVFFLSMGLFLLPIPLLFQQMIEYPDRFYLWLALGIAYIIFAGPFLALLASSASGLFTNSRTPEEMRKDDQIAARNISLGGLLQAVFWVGIMSLALAALALFAALQ